MYYRLKTTQAKALYILATSDYNYSNNNINPNSAHYTTKRMQAILGSPSYIRSQRRAFARAKMLAFYNPDLTHFVTFTYRANMTDPDRAIHDMKQFLKYQRAYQAKQKNPKPLKYIYIFERQKRGAIHAHMISNDAFKTFENKNGYPSLSYWKHGYSSYLHIKQVDKNFKPYLYLFKYMSKAEKIGASFVHISRNFDEIKTVDYADYIERLSEGELLFTEDIELIINDRQSRITKQYIKALPSNAKEKAEELSWKTN